MCGIAALFDIRGGDLLGSLRAMTGAVRHRGPDDEGFVLFAAGMPPVVLGGRDTPTDAFGHPLPYCPRERVDSSATRWEAGLGHRRLSIVDLSPAGHQPMSSSDGALWITYNGEVYNHIELRAELERAGATFSSRSDTEVILAAYREWDERCLERLNGMFAFVLVDWPRRRIFAARDRFGVKPLYWWVSPQGLLAFASEIKQFTSLPGWEARVNGQRAYDFLNWGLFDHGTETLFGGVSQLRGGEYLSLSLDEPPAALQPKAWYTLAPARVDWSDGDEVLRYRTLLEDSVRLRLRADVPVGSCLSGGLDSSSIVCIANRVLRESGAERLQNTFSARSTDPRYDEGEFIHEVVKYTGATNYQIDPPLESLFEVLPHITWHQDEPFGSTSIYAQWHVFALAARHRVKVMLDGQGGDEQLAGYHSFYSARFSRLVKQARFLQLAREISAVRRLQGLAMWQLLAYATSPLLPEALRQPLRRMTGRPSAAAPGWLDLERLGAQPRDPFVECGAKAVGLREQSLSQILYTSLPMLLHWEDRDSMAHSIEARVPFLDYRVVELALGLPDEAKLADGVSKRVLREAMRGLLPDRVRGRLDKIGFATAEENWLRHERPEAFRSALRNAIGASQGILRPTALHLLEDVIEGRRPFSFLPWRMISFGAWMSCFRMQLGPGK